MRSAPRWSRIRGWSRTVSPSAAHGGRTRRRTIPARPNASKRMPTTRMSRWPRGTLGTGTSELLFRAFALPHCPAGHFSPYSDGEKEAAPKVSPIPGVAGGLGADQPSSPRHYTGRRCRRDEWRRRLLTTRPGAP
jgi:hypothetical protein